MDVASGRGRLLRAAFVAGLALIAIAIFVALRHQQQLHIARQVEWLGSEDQATRERAERNLVRMGPPVVPQLVAALSGRSPAWLEFGVVEPKYPPTWIRYHAARALGQIGDPRAVPALVECVDSAEEDALGCVYTDQFEYLLDDELEHDSPAGAAITALALIGDERAVPVFIRATRKPAPLVQVLAVRELVRIGGDEAGEALVRLLDDANELVTRAATVGLIRMQHEPALQAFAKIAASPPRDSSAPWRQRAATKAVVEMAGQEGIDMAIELIRAQPADRGYVIADELLLRNDERAFAAILELANEPLGTPGREAARTAFRQQVAIAPMLLSEP